MKLNLLLDEPEFSGESEDEPVQAKEAAEYLKISVPDDNHLISHLITTAREQIEHYLKISLIPRTVTAHLRNELNFIELPYGPVKELLSISRYEEREVNDDIFTDSLQTETLSQARLRGAKFKKLDYKSSYVIVEYEAGYTNENFPDTFRTAILEQVAWLYENRGDEAKMSQLSPMVSINLKPRRRVN